MLHANLILIDKDGMVNTVPINGTLIGIYQGETLPRVGELIQIEYKTACMIIYSVEGIVYCTKAGCEVNQVKIFVSAQKVFKD